jgi:hypothetical protein
MFRKTLLASPFAAALRTTEGGRYSSNAGTPANPGTMIEKGDSMFCNLVPSILPSTEVEIFLFLPFLMVIYALSSCSIKVTFIACSKFVCRRPCGASASMSRKGEYIKFWLDSDEGHRSPSHRAFC